MNWEQLQEVASQLEEEKEKRVKLEQELEKYKQMTELPENSMPVDKTVLQAIFHQFYYACTKEPMELPQREISAEDEAAINKHDSTECVIRTINEDIPPPGLESSSTHPSESPRHPPDTPSRAQLLFESLITS